MKQIYDSENTQSVSTENKLTLAKMKGVINTKITDPILHTNISRKFSERILTNPSSESGRRFISSTPKSNIIFSTNTTVSNTKDAKSIVLQNSINLFKKASTKTSISKRPNINNIFEQLPSRPINLEKRQDTEMSNIIKCKFVNETYSSDSKFYYGKSIGKKTNSIAIYKNKESSQKPIKPTIKVNDYDVKYQPSKENLLINDKKNLKRFELITQGPHLRSKMMDSVLDQKTNRELLRSYSYSRKSFDIASDSGKKEIKNSILRHQDTFKNLFGAPCHTDRQSNSNKIFNQTQTNFRQSIERVIGGNYPIVKDDIAIKLSDRPESKRKEYKRPLSNQLFNKSSIVF